MKNKDVIRFILNAPRSAVVYLSICLSSELKDAVDEDAAHWWRLTRPGGEGPSRFVMFTVIAGQLKEFRNLIEVRMKQHGFLIGRGLLHLFLRPLSSLYIYG